MKVIVDDKIPYIRDAIQSMAGEVVFVPGCDINAELVRDAQALIVRTRTRCGRNLLSGSSVQFIVTATIGYDHIDTRYCSEAGIAWANCPGCNASSVAQYIESVLLLEAERRQTPLSALTLGIIGVGHVGSRVLAMSASYGMRVLCNDPLRAPAEGGSGFVGLSEIAENSDIITLHVPLSREGAYPTWHFVDDNFMQSLRRAPLFINTSRGEVVETQTLLRALDEGWISDAVLDVWEHEPDIHRDLLQRVFIGTPHIAGYSADGKANATRMALDAFSSHFGYRQTYDILPPEPNPNLIFAASPAEALLKIYDPRGDSRALKANPEQFEWLRGHYPLRREKAAYSISYLKPTQ